MVNIFGGIMRCDIIAEGIIGAAQELNLNVPIICRLQVKIILLIEKPCDQKCLSHTCNPVVLFTVPNLQIKSNLCFFSSLNNRNLKCIIM